MVESKLPIGNSGASLLLEYINDHFPVFLWIFVTCRCSQKTGMDLENDYDCINTVIDGCNSGFNDAVCPELKFTETTVEFANVANRLCAATFTPNMKGARQWSSFTIVHFCVFRSFGSYCGNRIVNFASFWVCNKKF